MILVDTTVWVDHLRRSDEDLVRLLEQARVIGHPFVLGELALGTIPDRAAVLALLADLPQAEIASHEEVMNFIEHERLAGSGVGYVDVHLLASTLLSAAEGLWTRDGRLRQAANRLGLSIETIQ